MHVEATAFLGWAWTTGNLVDGKDYSTVSLLVEVSAGYRFDLYQAEGWGLYLLPQGGVLQGLPPTSIGPRGGHPDTFVTAKLLFGARW